MANEMKINQNQGLSNRVRVLRKLLLARLDIGL